MMSAIENLEKRVAVLESEIAKLKSAKKAGDDRPWWDKIYGSFEGNRHFKEAMELGRKHREAQRRKVTKKKQ